MPDEPKLRQLCVVHDAVWEALERWADERGCFLGKMPADLNEPEVENYFLSPKEMHPRA